MKHLILLVFISTVVSFSAQAKNKCHAPEGKYTPLKMVLDQFVLGNGNPNWGDWCYDSGYEKSEESRCASELKAWDNWLVCAGISAYASFKKLASYHIEYCEDSLHDEGYYEDCLQNLDTGYTGEFVSIYKSKHQPSLEQFKTYFNETAKWQNIVSLDSDGEGICSAMNVADHACNVTFSQADDGTHLVTFKVYDTGE